MAWMGPTDPNHSFRFVSLREIPGDMHVLEKNAHGDFGGGVTLNLHAWLVDSSQPAPLDCSLVSVCLRVCGILVEIKFGPRGGPLYELVDSRSAVLARFIPGPLRE